MDNYIQQLIEDMRAAALQVPPPGEIWESVDMDNPAEVEDIAHVEQYFYGKEEPLEQIVGIATIALPPEEKLSEEQMQLLFGEMEKLLKAYHFVPEFPEDLPVFFKYRLLRENWDSPMVFVGAGEVNFRLCGDDINCCPYPTEFCDCLNTELDIMIEDEFDEINKNKKDEDDEEMPF